MSVTQQDIEKLIREPSANVRADIASKVSSSFNHSIFTKNENRIAIEIFRLLLKDTAIIVRQAMAESLKSNYQVPKDIIETLAKDVPDVADAILEHSILLEEDDLLYLISTTQEVKKWLAISRRKNVSAHVSQSLILTRNQDVAVSLLSNEGAAIEEEDIEMAITMHQGHENVLTTLVNRGNLPPEFAEKLFHRVSNQLIKHLTCKHGFSWKLMHKAAKEGHEIGILRFLVPYVSEPYLLDLIYQMERNKRLNYTLLIRALCQGEIKFFEMAMAIKADVSLENARVLMLDSGPLGFSALCDVVGIPDGFSEALKVIYRFSLTETNDGQYQLQDFPRRMIDRIQTNGYHHTVENMSYFMTLMEDYANTSATIH